MNLLTFCKEKVEPAKIKNNYKFDEETKREIFKEENTYESATDESRLSGDKNADTRGISSTTNEGTDDSMKNHDITSEPEEDSEDNDLKNKECDEGNSAAVMRTILLKMKPAFKKSW